MTDLDWRDDRIQPAIGGLNRCRGRRQAAAADADVVWSWPLVASDG